MGYFTEISAWTKNNPTIVVAIIALCGVLISASVAFLTGRRSVYISSVTAERSKWIDKLRSNIAELLRVCAEINNEVHKSVAYDDKRNKADGLIALITLQLNPADKDGIDNNLIDHLQILVKSSENRGDGFRTEEKKFVRHAQFMLKEEWETVKSEARGCLASLVYWLQGKKCSRKHAYDRFVQENLPWASKNK